VYRFVVRERQDYSRKDKHADAQPGVKVDRFVVRRTGKIRDGQTSMQSIADLRVPQAVKVHRFGDRQARLETDRRACRRTASCKG
jgi:hypothetical protein